MQFYVYLYIIGRVCSHQYRNNFGRKDFVLSQTVLSQRKKRRTFNNFIPFILIVIVLVLVGILGFIFLRPAKEDPLVSETVARLKTMEQKNVSSIGSTETVIVPEAPVEVSEDDIKARVLSGELLGNVEIRQKFAQTAIVGDSITESIWEYGYLDQDVVISKRGLSVANADDQFATAIAMNPRVVFLSFGSNDLESYLDNVDSFISGYRRQLQKLKDSLPGIPIYINLILPLTEGAIAYTPALQYYPQYNEALLELCKEMGCTPLDEAFIVEANPDMYEPDGQHVIASYYPMWLTYMAEMAGL